MVACRARIRYLKTRVAASRTRPDAASPAPKAALPVGPLPAAAAPLQMVNTDTMAGLPSRAISKPRCRNAPRAQGARCPSANRSRSDPMPTKGGPPRARLAGWEQSPHFRPAPGDRRQGRAPGGRVNALCGGPAQRETLWRRSPEQCRMRSTCFGVCHDPARQLETAIVHVIRELHLASRALRALITKPLQAVETARMDPPDGGDLPSGPASGAPLSRRGQRSLRERSGCRPRPTGPRRCAHSAVAGCCCVMQ
jgi:hypothetical protein